MQSFRAKNKEARKVHQENGAFIGFESQLDATKAPDGTQELSLSHVLKHLSPIVVVDECHRVKSDLSKEFIHNLNARFIL